MISGVRQIVEGGRVQSRVLTAIMLRELHTRFGRHHLGYLWVFLEPMILGGSIALLHYVSGHDLPGGMDVAAFYIVGYTPYYLFRAILNRASTTVMANLPLFYHRQVSYTDVMLARHVLDCATVTIAIFIMIGVLTVLGGEFPHDPLKIVVGVAIMAAFCHGFAMLILAATIWGAENVERLVHPFTYLMIPFTGAFIMVWWLPTELQAYALLNPTIHMFEFIRDGQFGPVVPYHWDLGYMLAATAVVNVLGMLAMRAVRGRLATSH
jgi:capsular polysaccharide transport system permease protein